MALDEPNSVFLTKDEAGLYLQVATHHVWSPLWQTPIARAYSGRAKTNFYVTLNLYTGQEITMWSDLMNTEGLAQNLKMILDTNPKLIVS